MRDVILLFLKLGLIGFGGPAAHVGMMHDEVVVRRRWLDEQKFLDLLGATNLIPGPNSTEMAIHIGFLRAGWPGFIAGGAAFILPQLSVEGTMHDAEEGASNFDEVLTLRASKPDADFTYGSITDIGADLEIIWDTDIVAADLGL